MTKYFEGTSDSRQQGKITYNLIEVIVMTIIAVTAGAEHSSNTNSFLDNFLFSWTFVLLRKNSTLKQSPISVNFGGCILYSLQPSSILCTPVPLPSTICIRLNISAIPVFLILELCTAFVTEYQRMLYNPKFNDFPIMPLINQRKLFIQNDVKHFDI